MAFVVGLTGGIGCGKSSASKFFSQLGIDVIDTDVIARTLTQSNGSAITMIKDTFGGSFITADNSLDRNKMRNLVFSNNDARLKLEKILHPLILEETILQAKQSQTPYRGNVISSGRSCVFRSITASAINAHTKN